MMDNARNLLHNAVNLGYVGAVWVNLVNDAVAIIACLLYTSPSPRD